MTLPLLYVDGTLVRPGRRLGRGGEGDVFTIDDESGRALKLYTVPDLAEREAKVRAMVRGGLAAKSALVAFPIAAVLSDGGRFVGFVMRSVVGHKPLFELYGPAARKRQFPEADFRFLVRVATNVARAIATVHESGCVIGDINHSGILVSEQAVAALIDADSFQFTDGGARHACRVGVPEYTAPELQGSSLRDVVRTRSHDEFGLAVVIFQLLFLGRHPYAGTFAGAGDMPIQNAIGQNRFAYTRVRDVGMSPPPHAVTLDDVPAGVAAAFEAAFAPAPARRPTAAEWASLMQELERHLMRCGAKSEHLFPVSAAQCPWCRMERGLGVTLFLPKALAGATVRIDDLGDRDFDIVVVWAEIQAVRAPTRDDIQPVLPTVDPDPGREALAAVERRTVRMVMGAVALAVSVAAIYLAPALILAWLGIGAFGINRLLTAKIDVDAARRRHAQARSEWTKGLETWRDRAGFKELETSVEALRRARADYMSLPTREKESIERHEAERHGHQLAAHLDRQQIRHARVDGVGTSLVTQLASHGIETAGHLVANRIMNVPGFGPVKTAALLEWRRSVEAKFRFSTFKTAAETAELAKIRGRFAAEASALRRTLSGGATQLETTVAMLKVRSAAADPELSRLHVETRGREADLTFLGIPVPAISSSPAAGTPFPSKAASSSTATVGPSFAPAGGVPAPSSGKTCPRCSRQMVLRTARRGTSPGRRFWGCAAYPSCQGTRPI
ncbi:topoisomerase DNA-binding C4 zinc finger domain-containing protein [Glacieibacterium megasporae]|uniref:topoisomerase DNA-binding C4 zinc finger domain-containing protein n=1 Tax=Glacieibacterium megasporae TaxID=2835787 RepID=UPI001C1E7CF6|nr:topoisomerase DNA-binding C4 zinc finger domain-containing protein [Polymorphobacter megasporae]UAJ10631.1 topoisomerase DNA-binding C4 zinc finger domain-containing protein [Polymorphobacter megasporae]